MELFRFKSSRLVSLIKRLRLHANLYDSIFHGKRVLISNSDFKYTLSHDFEDAEVKLIIYAQESELT